MKNVKNIKRREFISTTALTAATISIVPSHVIAGLGKTPPSDRINVANIGCGTQGLRELGDMLQHPEIQVVAVCDANKYTTNYLDWSANGLRDDIRKVLGDPAWGANVKGIAGGRDVGKEYVEKYYGKNKSSGKYKGCVAYEDFRELLEKEQGVDAVKVMTPDHLHATISIAAMKKGKHAISHKPIANRIAEGRLVIETARQTGLKTHLLAWSPRPEYEMVLSWIKDGVIGNLKEIHNWSYRPVWPQWTSNPTDTPPVPAGFNWDLWLGPVPHRPYNPNYTFNVFRGWYDFGGGSIADMGHYSLFPLFLIFGIDRPPVSAKAYGTTTRKVEDNVCQWVDNNVAFPYSSIIQLKFPEQRSLPAFDLYWYDGGMKPFAPEELEQDNQEIDTEGMMFVGDKGKILAGFRGEKPRIIPEAKMKAYTGKKDLGEVERESHEDTWVRAIKNDEDSPGSFLKAGCVTDAINLAAVALRAGKSVEFDASAMKITNNEAANQYLTREYRKGWELNDHI